MPDSQADDAAPLTPPAPIAPVAPESAGARVPLSAQEQSKLDEQVQGYVGDLASLDIHSDDFKTRIGRLEQLGSTEIAQAANASTRLLDRPLRTLRAGGATKNDDVSRGLVDLRNTVESLDPSRQELFSARRLLGVIPFGNRLRSYFDRYQSAQSHLNAIIETLYRGKDELLRDNAAIEEQKTQMWSLMQKTQAMIYLSKKIDAELTAKVAELETTDPERAKIVKESALFPVRQKSVDLLTQMAVNVQGYQALDLIKRNNVELVKGVDRATMTTVSALRTAVAVAQALTNQRLVLAQITALGATTSSMIESTSQMLGEQGAAIYKQAAEPTVQIEHLHRAFENIYKAMDAVDEYKVKAADSLAQTASALETEVDRAKGYLARTSTPQLRQ
jgi:uncharacterized protein YaaN involved in tellurite resistance